MYEVGKRIRMFREKFGFSQKEFADSINVKNTVVSNWERGLTRPDVDTLALICSVLDVSANDLLDIHFDSDDYTAHEKLIIKQYRKQLDLQFAVNVLLGIELPYEKK